MVFCSRTGRISLRFRFFNLQDWMTALQRLEPLAVVARMHGERRQDDPLHGGRRRHERLESDGQQPSARALGDPAHSTTGPSRRGRVDSTLRRHSLFKVWRSEAASRTWKKFRPHPVHLSQAVACSGERSRLSIWRLRPMCSMVAKCWRTGDPPRQVQLTAEHYSQAL